MGLTKEQIEIQSFVARVMNLCDMVVSALEKDDFQHMKPIALNLKKEAFGVAKVFIKQQQ